MANRILYKMDDDGDISAYVPDTISRISSSKLITINAKKVKNKDGFIETHFFKEDGTHFATIGSPSRQPSKNKKTIIINCWRWKINWI